MTMTVDDIYSVGPPLEDFETRQLRAQAAQELFGAEAPDLMKIDRFLLEGPLGSGGQGAVFKAYDERLERSVALKRLCAADVKSKARMLHEGQVLAKVDHPNVVQIHEVGEDETERPYLVMALVDGQPLDEWLGQTRRHWTQLVEIVCAVGDGLAAIHAKGVVHRDVKPKNIVITADGIPTLVDLGIATTSEGDPDDADGSSGAQATAGTIGYIAPEHYSGCVDHRSDQFGLCVTLYEALYGRRPPWSMTRSEAPLPQGVQRRGSADEGSDKSVVSTDESVTNDAESGHRFPVDGLEKLPKRLFTVLQRGLQHEPSYRFDDMEALVEALREVLPRPFRWWRLAAISGVAAAIALGYWAWQRTPPPGPCDEPNPVLSLWDEQAKQDVRDVFMHAGAAEAEAEPAFAKVDQMLEGAAVSIDARWTAACRAGREDPARQVTLAEVQYQRAALSTVIDGLGELGELGGPDLKEVPVRLVGPLERLEPQGSRDACEQSELTTAPADTVLGRIEDLRRRAVKEGIAGRYDEALELGAQALGLAESETLPPETFHPQMLERIQARLHLERGRLAVDAVRYDGAQPDLEAARAQAEVLGCDGLGAEALAQMAKAQLLAPHGSKEQANWASTQALEKFERTGTTGPRLAEALKNRGLYLSGMSDPAGALVLFDEAMKIWQEREPPTLIDRLGIADTMLNKGVAQARKGDTEEAIETLRKALSIREEALWPEHPSMYKLHASLSHRYFELRKLEEAQRSMERALTLAESGLGEGSARVATLHIAMTRIFDYQGDFSEALHHAERADEILEEFYGPSDLRRVDALEAIGQVHMNANSPAEAVSPLDRALAIQVRSEGATALERAMGQAKLAWAHSTNDDYDKAYPLFSDAHEVFAADPLGRDHAYYPDLLMGWGTTLIGLGKNEDAIEPLTRAIALWSKTGSNPERLAHAQWWLAEAACATKPDEAERAARDAQKYFEAAGTPGASRMNDDISAWLLASCPKTE